MGELVRLAQARLGRRRTTGGGRKDVPRATGPPIERPPEPIPEPLRDPDTPVPVESPPPEKPPEPAPERPLRRR